METCASDVLVGLKEVGKLILERVDQGVVGAVEEESLYRMVVEMVVMMMMMRERNITDLEGSLAASLSIDMRGVMPVPPPMKTWITFW